MSDVIKCWYSSLRNSVWAGIVILSERECERALDVTLRVQIWIRSYLESVLQVAVFQLPHSRHIRHLIQRSHSD